VIELVRGGGGEEDEEVEIVDDDVAVEPAMMGSLSSEGLARRSVLLSASPIVVLPLLPEL
jgi:hypothetical protein